jgi:hypothetical protein
MLKAIVCSLFRWGGAANGFQNVGDIWGGEETEVFSWIGIGMIPVVMLQADGDFDIAMSF